MAKRQKKATKGQIDILLDYIAVNPVLADPFLTKHSGHGSAQSLCIEEKWDELTDILNSSGVGPVKSKHSWRRVLSELKYSANRKARKIINHHDTSIVLNNVDEKLLSITKYNGVALHKKLDKMTEQTTTSNVGKEQSIVVHDISGTIPDDQCIKSQKNRPEDRRKDELQPEIILAPKDGKYSSEVHQHFISPLTEGINFRVKAMEHLITENDPLAMDDRSEEIQRTNPARAAKRKSLNDGAMDAYSAKSNQIRRLIAALRDNSCALREHASALQENTKTLKECATLMKQKDK